MKILIADDTELSLKPLAEHCNKLGLSVLTAKNGAEAIDLFSSESPDLVLMNSIMPVIDGYEAASRIKAYCGGRWVPIILVAPLNGEEEVRRWIESDADDYLIPPINIPILDQKIKFMQRIFEMQLVLGESIRNAEQHYHRFEEEMGLAKRVMDKIIHLGDIDKDLTQHWIMPANNFSGDLIAVTRAYSNNIYAILADAAGHGLSAALTVLPIMQIFYAMSDKGCPIEGIAEELNWRIHAQMPTGCHIAAVLVSVDLRGRSIKVWNGGSPPAVFMGQRGEILHHWKSRHLPLGILSKDDFNGETEVFQWEEPGQLIIYSDGLLEAEDPEGRAFGSENMFQVLSHVQMKDRFSTLVKSVSRHLGGRPGQDDISLLMINCPLVRVSERPRPQLVVEKAKGKAKGIEGFIDWGLSFHLGPEKIRSLNILQLSLDWLHLMNISRSVSGLISVVISELYNNALEHGLLGLDSSIKLQSGGFDEYLSQREERLAFLDQGYINIEIEQVEINGNKMLRIHVKDSGDGFNYNEESEQCRYLDGQKMDPHSGNGIPPFHKGNHVVKSLCSKVEYLGSGNEVAVEYPL